MAHKKRTILRSIFQFSVSGGFYDFASKVALELTFLLQANQSANNDAVIRSSDVGTLLAGFQCGHCRHLDRAFFAVHLLILRTEIQAEGAI
jgi:hypothetical protein